MDIDRDELDDVFLFLDDDGSGQVSYEEFCGRFHKLRDRNPQTTLAFIRCGVRRMERQLEEHTERVQEQLAGASLAQRELTAALQEQAAGLARLEARQEA